jgi:hypothetical protein
MTDEGLNMALEMLRRELKCDNHAIGVANSNMTQCFQVALACKDAESQHYDEYRIMFGNKRWIFCIVNDASGSFDQHGTHWSFVVVDRVHRTAHYIDSMFVFNTAAQKLGCDISLGLLKILGEDESQWRYYPEMNSPHQNWHNGYSHDAGACGPFVFKMTEILVETIEEYQAVGREHECSMRIPSGYHLQFKKIFDSWDVRQDIAHRMVRWKTYTDSVALAAKHDQAAVIGEDVVLLDTPATAPPRPGPVHAASSTESSDSSTEASQDKKGGVAIDDDEPNYTIIGDTDEEMDSDTSIVVSEPAEDIMLDPVEKVTYDETDGDDLDNILREVTDDSSPLRPATPSPYFRGRSTGTASLGGDSTFEDDGPTTPVMPRVRAATPGPADRDHDSMMYGRHFIPRERLVVRRDSDTWFTDANN